MGEVTIRAPHGGAGTHTLVVAIEVDDDSLLRCPPDVLVDLVADRTRQLARDALVRWHNARTLPAVLADVPYTLEQLQSGNQSWPLSRVRQDVMLALREAGWSYPKIGRMLNRNHTTVIHGCKQAARRRDMARARVAVEDTRRRWAEQVPA